jgi:hypothetical protein
MTVEHVEVFSFVTVPKVRKSIARSGPEPVGPDEEEPSYGYG